MIKNQKEKRRNHPKYQQIHTWLTKTYGKSDLCENKDCQKKSLKYTWALKKGCCYDFKRENFFKLCYSCHIKYDCTDEKRKKLSALNLGKVYSQKTIDKMIIANKKKAERRQRPVTQMSISGKILSDYESIKKASIATGVDKSSINNCVAGRYHTAGGFIWEYKK